MNEIPDFQQRLEPYLHENRMLDFGAVLRESNSRLNPEEWYRFLKDKMLDYEALCEYEAKLAEEVGEIEIADPADRIGSSIVSDNPARDEIFKLLFEYEREHHLGRWASVTPKRTRSRGKKQRDSSADNILHWLGNDSQLKSLHRELTATARGFIGAPFADFAAHFGDDRQWEPIVWSDSYAVLMYLFDSLTRLRLVTIAPDLGACLTVHFYGKNGKQMKASNVNRNWSDFKLLPPSVRNKKSVIDEILRHLKP